MKSLKTLLRALSDGKKITKASWSANEYVQLVDNEFRDERNLIVDLKYFLEPSKFEYYHVYKEPKYLWLLKGTSGDGSGKFEVTSKRFTEEQIKLHVENINHHLPSQKTKVVMKVIDD